MVGDYDPKQAGGKINNLVGLKLQRNVCKNRALRIAISTITEYITVQMKEKL